MANMSSRFFIEVTVKKNESKEIFFPGNSLRYNADYLRKKTKVSPKQKQEFTEIAACLDAAVETGAKLNTKKDCDRKFVMFFVFDSKKTLDKFWDKIKKINN